MRYEIVEELDPEIVTNEEMRLEVERKARNLSARLARGNETMLNQNQMHDENLDSENLEDDEILEDDEAALRWRRALLRLSETFLDAAEERRDLSPILLGALHNALEQLLIHGEEDDLMALEDWLSHEGEDAQDQSTPNEARNGDFLMAGVAGEFSGNEKRVGIDRRSLLERRQAERRSLGLES